MMGTINRFKDRALNAAAWTAILLAAGVATAQAEGLEEVREFHIEAQALDAALIEFSEQSDLQLMVPTELVAGRQSPGISGEYAGTVALAALLDDYGLSFTAVGADTVAVSSHGEDNDQGKSRPASRQVLMAQNQASEEEKQTGATKSDDDEEGRLELERIRVTGSHIRRFEGPSPVIVMTRQDLDRSGRSTVAEALAQLPQNNALPITPGVTSSGVNLQGVNLRGLGADNTLVLVNGRRVSTAGLSGASFFVDLNSIPLAAVERIEVLPDGASAIYGSDAVAGVVNIILKKDFVGSEISLSGGFSQEGGADERQASLTTGWAKGGFNVLLTGEYFDRDRLAARDRLFSRTDDLRARGGRDLRFDFANPGNVFSLDGQNLPGLDAPFAGIPAGQDGRSLTPGDFAATAGQLNRQSLFADFSDLVPASERFGLNARLDGKLTSWLTVFAEAGISNTETKSNSNPPLFSVVVPETNPFNPFGEPVQVVGLVTEITSVVDFETDNQRVVVGLEGRLGQWVGETSFGYSRDESDLLLAVFPSISPIIANELLARTDPATALNVFGAGAGANNPEVLAEFDFAFNSTRGVSDVLTVAGKADGPVLEWAGRELRAALGWEYREETFESAQELQFIEPGVPDFTRVVEGDREIIAGFAELDLPLFGPEHGIPGLRALELQVAARFENYSDFGDTVDPKLALRWLPIESVAVRGSVGTSFRAPSLRELFAVTSPFQSTVTDPQRNDETVVVDRISGGNPNLGPEESRSWNLGLVWDAPFLPGLSLTADYWGLRQTEQVTTLSIDELLAAEAFFPERITRAEPTEEDIDAGRPGRLLTLDATSINASEFRLRGIDIGLKYALNSAFGRFDLRFNGAFIDRAKRQLTPVAPVEELAGTLGSSFADATTDRPEAKWRLKSSLFWSRGPWEAGVTGRYTGRSRDPFSTLHPVVSSHVEVDVQVNYAWPGTTGLLAGTRLSLGAVNVFNNEPPFRDSFFGFAGGLHDPRQAFYQLRLTKAF